MAIYGDGSDGVLNVSSGTRSLPLDVKHQFESVTIANGATLTTSSNTGSVLFITAKESITINGTLDVSNKLLNGANNYYVTLDGITFYNPSVRNGGAGDIGTGQTQAAQLDGFGGGGGGGNYANEPDGGNGGSGGASNVTGGASNKTVANTNQDTHAPDRDWETI